MPHKVLKINDLFLKYFRNSIVERNKGLLTTCKIIRSIDDFTVYDFILYDVHIKLADIFSIAIENVYSRVAVGTTIIKDKNLLISIGSFD